MKDFNKIFLPLGSDNENIETVSRKEFIRLFDAERFIVKDEFIDNGIDFRVEIVKNNYKLGFGFNFQLKAKIISNSNSDGSHSKSLETSNIEYLINNGQPGFYGFYVKNENKIYYEDLNKFVKSLHEKSPDWEDQQNHTLRFTKILDENAVDEIYNIAIEQGKLLRELNYRLAIESASNLNNNKIIINFDKTITDDVEIRKAIENYGLSLINETRWNDVLLIHKKASGNVANTAKYNLVIGIACYYNNNIFEAISFFKAALKKISDLDDELKNHLVYFDTVSKYALGIISNEEYFSKINELENSDYIGLYIKLEKAKNKYILSINSEKKDAYEQLTTDIDQIINDPRANSNIKLLAKCDLILFDGHRINMGYVSKVALINAIEEQIGPDIQMRSQGALELIKERDSWEKLVNQVRKEAFEEKNFVGYYNSTINSIKINYEFEVYSSIVNVSKAIPDFTLQPIPAKEDFFNEMKLLLGKAYSYYLNIGHLENAITSLSIKYEVEHYLKDFNSSSTTLFELEDLVNTVDSVEIKRKLKVLKQEGTTHERFAEFIKGIFQKTRSNDEEIESLIKEMKGMDEDEKKANNIIKDSFQINLYPIGYFSFPIDSVREVMAVIKVTDESQKTFIYMFNNGIIPIANIYKDIVENEGYGQGRSAFNGLDSWRNIYRIRKYFFDKNFYRMHLKFS